MSLLQKVVKNRRLIRSLLFSSVSFRFLWVIFPCAHTDTSMSQVMPWTGMILAYEWTFFGFIVLFGKYLDLVQSYGRKFAVPISSSSEDFPEYRSAKGMRFYVLLYGEIPNAFNAMVGCFHNCQTKKREK